MSPKQEYDATLKRVTAAPIGLYGFAATTFVLSLYNLTTRGVSAPNGVVGIALAYGGVAQFVAGVWELFIGNVLTATAFCSYGAFWISYSILFIPWFNVEGAYISAASNDIQLGHQMFNQAVGLYLIAWFILTFLLLIASFRSSLGLVLLFLFLDVTFLMLSIAEFTGSINTKRAGGAFGLAAAAMSWYCGTKELLKAQPDYFIIPDINLAKRQ